MKNLEISFSVVFDRFGEFKAMMNERFMHSDRFFYIMDETGQHEFVHEKYIYSFKNVGQASCGNANAVLNLLNELNHDIGCNDVKTYIWAFKELQARGKDKISQLNMLSDFRS